MICDFAFLQQIINNFISYNKDHLLRIWKFIQLISMIKIDLVKTTHSQVTEVGWFLPELKR